MYDNRRNNTINVRKSNLHLKKAQEAKELLDSIISHYDVYSMEFTFHSDKDIEKIKKRMSPEILRTFRTDKQILNDRIRDYIDFDDSE